MTTVEWFTAYQHTFSFHHLFTGPSRRFRRVCEHIQSLMLGPRGDALSQRKISTDSSSSYTSECGASPTHSISVTRADCDDEVILDVLKFNAFITLE